MILFQQHLKGHILHVVPEDHEIQFPISELQDAGIAQVKVGAALIGYHFDAIIISVPITFKNYSWFMAPVFTRLVPQ